LCSFFEKLFQLSLGIELFLFHRTTGGGVTKFKVITEIAPVLFHNPLRQRFMAVIVGPGIIKPAVETDVQIAPAEGTGVPPAHDRVSVEFFFTRMTDLHCVRLPRSGTFEFCHFEEC